MHAWISAFAEMTYLLRAFGNTKRPAFGLPRSHWANACTPHSSKNHLREICVHLWTVVLFCLAVPSHRQHAIKL